MQRHALQLKLLMTCRAFDWQNSQTGLHKEIHLFVVQCAKYAITGITGDVYSMTHHYFSVALHRADDAVKLKIYLLPGAIMIYLYYETIVCKTFQLTHHVPVRLHYNISVISYFNQFQACILSWHNIIRDFRIIIFNITFHARKFKWIPLHFCYFILNQFQGCFK